MQPTATMGGILWTVAWYYAGGIIFLSICVHIVHCCKALVKRKRRTKLPPGPPGWPILGNLFLLGKKPNESLFHLAQKYGPLITLRLGMKTTVVVSSPAVANEILKKNDHICAFRAVPQARGCLSPQQSSTIWVQCGPRWRMLRRICNAELFSAIRLNALQHLRREQVFQMIGLIFEDYLKGNTVNIAHDAFATSCTLLWNMIFTQNAFPLHSSIFQEFKETIWETTRMAEAPNLADFFPVIRFADLHTGAYVQRVFRLFDKLIEYRLSSSKYKEDAAEAKDFFDVLMDAQINGDGETVKFTRADMKSLLFDIFSAGSGTISTTVEWAMAELIRNPPAMYRAQAELEEVVGRDRRVEESDIQHLRYLEAVVEEVLRLHPPFPLLLPHRAGSSCEVAGFLVPKDIEIIVNSWGMGRDPSVWDEPLEFVPERFLQPGMGMDCKGSNLEPILPLGNDMIRWLLASLVHSFDWSLPGGQSTDQMDMTEKFGVNLLKAAPLNAVPKARLSIIL